MIGPELTLFIIVGAIAIFAAVMMLISENAVHSALFLILNFAAVAFMYLMMNAAFLAMVQITVYAGAIMVLFLFVIMLLGAEKLLPEGNQRFSWLTPLAIAATAAILLIASIAILQSEVDASEPEPNSPLVRVVNAASEVGPVDVYLNDDMLASDVPFANGSEYTEQAEGEFTLAVFEHGADSTTSTPLMTETVFLAGNDVVSLVILPELINDSTILRVDGNLDPVEDRNTTRLTVVHAMPCSQGCAVDIADVSDPAEDPAIFTAALDYGEIAPVEILRRDQYTSHEFTLGVYAAGDIDTALSVATGEDALELESLIQPPTFEVYDNDSLLWIIVADTRTEMTRPDSIFLEDNNEPEFGSARGVGELIFIDYLLPFETIAVLLLVAMVGTIVLTKDAGDPARRRRQVRRMAAVPGNPTVDEYLEAVNSGSSLPEPPSAKQLSSGE